MKPRQTTRFAIIPEWVLLGASANAVKLYCLLDRHANRDGSCWPSRERLAEQMACSVDTIDRTVRELQTIGALEREHRFRDNGSQTSSVFCLLRDPPAAGGGRKSAAGGSVTGAAPKKNESQIEREPEDQDLALSRRKRNPVWDFVVEVAGEPLPRHRVGRGAVVSDLTQLLDRESVPEDARKDVLRRRLSMLAREWGDAKATPRALVHNWELAARLDRGEVRGPANGRVTAMDMVARTRETQRRSLDAS